MKINWWTRIRIELFLKPLLRRNEDIDQLKKMANYEAQSRSFKIVQQAVKEILDEQTKESPKN